MIVDVNEQSAGVCPEPEQLAAYIDGQVTAEERAAIQRHLADCEDCREVVADAVRLRDEPPETTVLPFWRRRKTQAIGGGILALAASLILVVQVRPELNPFRQPTPLEELAAAVGTTRTVEGRVTGGFAHAPMRSAVRGGVQLVDAQILAAAAHVQQLASERPTEENLHALGVAHLVAGRPEAAVAQLDDLVGRNDSSARLRNDLGAALLARSRMTSSVSDAERALVVLRTARNLDPSLPEAQFNLALAYDYLGRKLEADREWREYTRLFNDSWAPEALSRVRGRTP